MKIRTHQHAQEPARQADASAVDHGVVRTAASETAMPISIPVASGAVGVRSYEGPTVDLGLNEAPRVSRREESQRRLVKIAVAKSEHYDGNVWAAYLVPAEIVALARAGAKLDNERNLAWNEKKIQDGESGGVWCYFTPSPDLLAALLKQHPRHPTR